MIVAQQYLIMSEGVGKCGVYGLFIFTILAMCSAIGLLIIEIIDGYIGFTGTVPLSSAAACLSTYGSLKYTNLTVFIEITFILSIATVAFSLMMFISILVWVVKICKSPTQQNQENSLRKVGAVVEKIKNLYQTSKKLLIFLYIISSFNTISAGVVFGYYLTFYYEASLILTSSNSCTYVSDLNVLLILLLVAAATLLFALLCWIFITSANAKHRGEDFQEITQKTKYLEMIQTHPTEPEDKYQAERRKNNRPLLNKVEETKENIFESTPEKKKNEYQTYSKESPPIGQSRPIYESRYQKRSPYDEKKSPVKEEKQHPGELVYANKLNYIPPKSYKKEDDDVLRNEERRYLNNYARPILPSRGLEEKDNYRNERSPQDNYYKNGDLNRKYKESSPAKQVSNDREGMLLNYIRGKYAAN